MGDQKLPPGQGTGGPHGEIDAQQSHGNLENMHLQGESGEGSLDELPPLQDVYQKQSKPMELLSGIAKMISDVQDSIMTKGSGGGGTPGAGKKKTGPFLLVGVLLLVGAAFVALRFAGPSVGIPNPGPPEAPVAQVPDPIQFPPNPCALEFTNPPDAAGIPLQGALNVEWSEVPGAASYELQVIPPEGGGNPWVIPTDGTSKNVFMENFPAAGEYKFALRALDEDGALMCGIEMVFEKGAYDEAARQAKDPEAGPCLSLLACP